jgi:hypothetical protein
MPKLPTAPDLSNAPQVGLYKQYQDALAKQAALKAPDPNQLRPHWYDRLLGGVVGAASNDAGAGGNVTNRRLINANREYQAQEAPLQKQLANIRGGAELAKGAAEVPQQGFENQMQIEKAGENQAQPTKPLKQRRKRKRKPARRVKLPGKSPKPRLRKPPNRRPTRKRRKLLRPGSTNREN